MFRDSGWEGEAPAEPKTTVNSDQRMANSFSEGQCSRTAEKFSAYQSSLEGRAPARPKIFGTSGDVPYSFIARLAGFVFVDTDLESVDELL